MKKAHILVFPYPAQGHILALLDLTHQLALRDLAITIVVTPKNLPILAPLLSAHSATAVRTLVLPFPAHPDLSSLGVEHVRNVGNAGNIPFINALSNLHDPILHWFRTTDDPPSAIVSDFFLGWTVHLANKLNIPRIAFFSVRPLLAAMFHRLWDNISSDVPSVLHFPDFPRPTSFKYEHLPSLFRRCRESSNAAEAAFVGECMLANKSSWGFVFNTFEALEGDWLRYMKEVEFRHGRVFGVGPLSLLGVQGTNSKIDPSVAAWLDQCPEDSVIYVCFGSQKMLDGLQMEALAAGLERSGVRFIWVAKTVPEGFEERMWERGMVIRGWAPQVAILGHKAVGGFLSHCGWNSTLEAVAAGVRMVCWPMEADQYVNAGLVAEEKGVAARVVVGADGVPDADELGEAIARLMSDDAPEKVRAKELGVKAAEAVRHCGSSANVLDELVLELRKQVNG